MKFSFCCLLALVPLAAHAQLKGMISLGQNGQGTMIISNGDNRESDADVSAGRVEVKLLGRTEADTTYLTSPDSAAAIVKASKAQVIFLDSGRATAKALGKLDPQRILRVRLEQGDAPVKQYGDVAKAGVLTVTTRPLPAASDSAAKH
jgi:hypothetical protein